MWLVIGDGIRGMVEKEVLLFVGRRLKKDAGSVRRVVRKTGDRGGGGRGGNVFGDL